MELVTELGLDAEALLLEAGVPFSSLENPDTKLSYRCFLRALSLAAAGSGLPHFGLLLAQRQQFSMLGPLGAAVIEARNVRHGIELTNTYLHLQVEGAFARLDVSEHLATWTYRTLLPSEPGAREQEDQAAAFGLKVLRRLTSPDWSPDYLALPRSAPSDAGPYIRYFGCEVRFSAEVTRIGFDAALLERKNPVADWHVVEVLEGYLRSLAESARLQGGSGIQKVLAQAILRGDSSLASVAQALGMSARSLQRHLSARDSSFQAELDRVRSDLARRYLEEGTVPLAVLADMLGYSDLAAFSRAFKRMTGSSPLAWRRRPRVQP